MALSRIVKWVIAIAAVLVALPVAAFVFLLILAPGASEDEVARVASPDDKLEAVLVETNGGATTSFGYEIYIIPRAAKPRSPAVASLYGAVRNENAYGANLRWASSNQLMVEFLDAKLSKLELPHLSVDGREVHVTLRPGTLDATAPAGGMFYNLRSRQ